MASIVVEHLRYKVKQKDLPIFLQGERVWTEALSSYPGFISKEIWMDRDEPDNIIVIIKWASYLQWKSIPEQLLSLIRADYEKVVGDKKFKILEEKEYDCHNALIETIGFASDVQE
jgi:uncharacterized protein (TIGR03792 family)